MIESIETNLEEQGPDQPVGPEQGELVVRRWRGLERRLGRELLKIEQTMVLFYYFQIHRYCLMSFHLVLNLQCDT